MGAATAATAAAVGGTLLQADASRKSARAAGKAARAQQDESARQFDITQDNINKAVKEARSPQEFAALTRALSQQEAQVAQQTKLFEALDPAVLEASQQALQLLQGQEAKALDPIRKQRDRQRQKLVNRLREQLGAGAETSTAGIQALNQFDTQTDETLFQAQQGSIGQLFGLGQSGAAGRGALNQSIAGIANIGQGFGNIAARQAQTRLGGAGLLQQAGQQQIQTAGGQFVGKQLEAQGQAQLFGNISQAGFTALGKMSFDGGGDATK